MGDVRAIAFGGTEEGRLDDLHAFLAQAIANGDEGGFIVTFKRQGPNGSRWDYRGAGTFSTQTAVYAIERLKLDLMQNAEATRADEPEAD